MAAFAERQYQCIDKISNADILDVVVYDQSEILVIVCRMSAYWHRANEIERFFESLKTTPGAWVVVDFFSAAKLALNRLLWRRRVVCSFQYEANRVIVSFYVPWDWHVKSAHAPVDSLRLPMLLMNPWRLPLLFFVSGVALRFALENNHNRGFLLKRTYRLIVSFLFGMWVVCAPQAYYELVPGGHFQGSVLEFYRGYATVPWMSPESWPIITPTWNHLWYLLYVLLFSITLVAVSLLSSQRFDQLLDKGVEQLLRHPAVTLGSRLRICTASLKPVNTQSETICQLSIETPHSSVAAGWTGHLFNDDNA